MFLTKDDVIQILALLSYLQWLFSDPDHKNPLEVPLWTPKWLIDKITDTLDYLQMFFADAEGNIVVTDERNKEIVWVLYYILLNMSDFVLNEDEMNLLKDVQQFFICLSEGEDVYIEMPKMQEDFPDDEEEDFPDDEEEPVLDYIQLLDYIKQFIASWMAIKVHGENMRIFFPDDADSIWTLQQNKYLHMVFVFLRWMFPDIQMPPAEMLPMNELRALWWSEYETFWKILLYVQKFKPEDCGPFEDIIRSLQSDAFKRFMEKNPFFLEW